MQKENTYVIIMAGGVGIRLWPYSRKHRPKQFLDVLGTGTSLLQATYARMLRYAPKENILVVTLEAQVALARAQLVELKEEQFLCEPTRRNTAPCLAYATYKIRARCEDAMIMVTPADHVIEDEQALAQTLETARKAAGTEECLVTLGIKPTRPETGYGYIQFLPEGEGLLRKVKTFTEKPHEELAKKFFESGEFLWNSGIFVWRLSSIVQAFERYAPEIAEIFGEGNTHYYTKTEEAFLKKAYAQVSNISIDYAIMEKHHQVYVVCCDFGWSDIGSWDALYDLKKKDENDNVFVNSEGLVYGSRKNIVHLSKKKLVLLEGLEDYLVADLDDMLVVCKKKNEARFREFIADLRARDERYV